MPDNNFQIQIFVTGGTFDKEYNYINGQLYFKDTHLPQMFERGRSKLDVDIKTLMMVDSLEMTDADREIIVYNCKKSDINRIVITHGTDTMVNTAAAIAKEQIDKTIIITGAMVPYAFGTSSDGFFNLGAAMAFAQVLEPGVYIAMNGRYYNWDNVRKNTQTGYFETLKS
ncbi:MAG: asparaginase [Chitinophagales bacterium]|nr:asparaginase [Chitinophagales bacterium]